MDIDTQFAVTTSLSVIALIVNIIGVTKANKAYKLVKANIEYKNIEQLNLTWTKAAIVNAWKGATYNNVTATVE